MLRDLAFRVPASLFATDEGTVTGAGQDHSVVVMVPDGSIDIMWVGTEYGIRIIRESSPAIV